jgi:hypothetical protein
VVSEKSKIPVIVTMSGKLDVDPDTDMTAEQIFGLVKERYGVDMSKTREPFVVVHDQIRAKYRVVEGSQPVGDVDGLREVVRVVMPLKG